MRKSIILGIIISVILMANSSCKKNTNTNPHLIFKFVFDSTEARLNNLGVDTPMAAGHAGQNPQMNAMSAHYIELAPNAYTALGAGVVLYKTPTTNAGGAGTNAIDFADEVLTPNNGTFYSVALDSVTPGTYQWLRISLAYQNYGVNLYIDTTISSGGYQATIDTTFPCTVASFVGENTYISSYTILTTTEQVNANELQGYWGFESEGTYNGTVSGVQFSYPYDIVETGQAPAGATTVVNPLFATSPIPAGSCVATGQFTNSTSGLTTNTSPAFSLTIPPKGTATSDIVVTVYVSTNKSFEWVEVVQDGKWQPSIGENIVNMGIRGIIPVIGQ